MTSAKRTINSKRQWLNLRPDRRLKISRRWRTRWSFVESFGIPPTIVGDFSRPRLLGARYLRVLRRIWFVFQTTNLSNRLCPQTVFARSGHSADGEKPTLNDQQFRTVAVQLQALGLVKLQYTPSTTGDMGLFWSLTPPVST